MALGKELALTIHYYVLEMFCLLLHLIPEMMVVLVVVLLSRPRRAVFIHNAWDQKCFGFFFFFTFGIFACT